jgi:hypothetical protein
MWKVHKLNIARPNSASFFHGLMRAVVVSYEQGNFSKRRSLQDSHLMGYHFYVPLYILPKPYIHQSSGMTFT